MIYIRNTFLFTEFETFLNHLKCTIFSTGGFRSVYSFQYMCSWFLCCVCGL